MAKTHYFRIAILTLILGFTLACANATVAMEQGVPQASADTTDKLVLVHDGKSFAPIVIYENAPQRTRASADMLAEYIEKTAGVKPQVIVGKPDPMPTHAIWVGYQPALDALFPGVDFKFKHPEEILIAANANHLVIAGRDVWNPEQPDGLSRGERTIPGVQREYGTINAVYTFLRDGLGVRWIWPGELGEDILPQQTLAFAPFEYRHHPTIRMRDSMMSRSSLLKYRGKETNANRWVQAQRLQLDSMEGDVGGHAYNDWWEKYHETHPEYFAMHPDGTRGLVTDAESVKLCHSNPAVWQQWVDNVAEQIAKHPEQTVFNASPGDGGFSGHCVCDNCKAWDNPKGELVMLRSGGVAQNYVSLTDRHLTYANKVARMLKERFPERNDLVSLIAYGAWRSPPVAVKPDDNVVIVNVANFFWDLRNSGEADDYSRAEWFEQWAATGAKQIWRPNTGSPAGWQAGLPDIPIGRVVESMQFVADKGASGIFVDMIWEMWGTQGPLYYAMAHVAWDPHCDWQAIMDDYYQRGFGPAGDNLKAYWTMQIEARNRKVDEYPGEVNGYAEVYDDAFFTKAYAILDGATQKAQGAPEKYAKRIAFVRAGLDHMHICTLMRRSVLKYLASNQKDQAAAQEARELWAKMKLNCEENPDALVWNVVQGGRRMHRVGLFNVDSLDKAKDIHISAWTRKAKEQAGMITMKKVALQSAQKAGWELVFEDNFDRDSLGDNWQTMAGNWQIKDGALHGTGTLISAKGYPGGEQAGFIRMEFKATASADVPRVSDLSCLLHTRPSEEQDKTYANGYFMQFGSKWNTMNNIRRNLDTLIGRKAAEGSQIIPGKTHDIVVENNKGKVNLFVDGVNILATADKTPFVGEGFDRVGFFFYTPAVVDDVKVYVKRIAGGLDEDESEVN